MKFVNNYRQRYARLFDLMKWSVNKVLLVASSYEQFVLEEDGGLNDELTQSYHEFRQDVPPKIVRVSTTDEALNDTELSDYDLLITMSVLSDPYDFGRRIKEKCPSLSTILLLTNASEIQTLSHIVNKEGMDYTFLWNGSSELILAMIKLIEDKNNAKFDVKHGNVPVILFIEDSVVFYSLFLPIIYQELVINVQDTISHLSNNFQRLFYIRSRPKILFARTYEEAIAIYEEFESDLMAIISDVRFSREGKDDPEAGFTFIEQALQKDPFLPTLINSSKLQNFRRAKGINSDFLHKSSSKLLFNLKKILRNNLGFGDFIFSMLDREDKGFVTRVRTLKDMSVALKRIPEDTILFHANKNHFSNWLLARGEVELSKILEPIRTSDYQVPGDLRNDLIRVFNAAFAIQSEIGISDFNKDIIGSGAQYFMKVGSGSLGGKGRGLAFLRLILRQENLTSIHENVMINIPNTIAITTEFFDEFMHMNQLYDIILDDISDEEIVEIMLSKELPDDLVDILEVIAKRKTNPLSVRSSSLYEDSRFLPFAGIYKTYMISNSSTDWKKRLEDLQNCVKLVYASCFSRNAKSYFQTTGNNIESEKMAVLIQSVVGTRYGDLYYPEISGVAQSYNYYATSHMEPKDGIAEIAMGLGFTVVEGAKNLRFCPAYPSNVPQLSIIDEALKNTQSRFTAINMEEGIESTLNSFSSEYTFLKSYYASEHATKVVKQHMISTYDYRNHRIVDGTFVQGSPVLTFSPILRRESFPLCSILKRILEVGERSFAGPIEVEFSIKLKEFPSIENPHQFIILQMRPLVIQDQKAIMDVENLREKSFLFTDGALGNGVIYGIKDIVFVKPEAFKKTETREIKQEIHDLNAELADSDRKYLLIGFGRWGTSDRFLGIPVVWEDIYYAKVLVEASRADFRVDPSQGMHFFVNVTSIGLGYFTIKYGDAVSFIDWEWLNSQPVYNETKYLKHIRFEKDLRIVIDGTKGIGACKYPEIEDDSKLPPPI